jgi:ferric-dicitrate binding protein FerR (iron transport regulator)
MSRLARAGWIACSSLLLLTAHAAAQPAKLGCNAELSALGTQTLRCPTAITIVAESGAKFELRDRNRDGHVDSVELSNKALLLEVPKQPGRAKFDVVTPQAIAAVRGTKWAVDAEGAKTSVFVVNGSVSVARPAGRGSVVLGAGDGVDIEPSGELIVKRWPPARVTALMARLGQ